MKQLTMGAILNVINILKAQGLTEHEIKHLPIYIGNDDELNGIHTAWFVDIVDTNKDDENNEAYVEMINEDHHNIKLDGKGILIS